MQNDLNIKTINQNFENLSLKNDSKYDEDTLDEAIINGLKGEHKEFCRRIETFLNNFMKGSKNMEVIPEINKYQRKIVHKICDLYSITREYVDIKSDELGTITITKNEKSFIPSTTLDQRYQKYLEKNKKQSSGQQSNPFSNKKVLIKTRITDTKKKEISDKSEHSDPDSTHTSQLANVDIHEEYENKKKREYEQARDRILQESEENEKEMKANLNQNPNLKQKKPKRTNQGYDPDFDRSRGQPDLGVYMGPTNPINTINPMGQMIPPPGMQGMGYYPMYNNPTFIQYQGYMGSNPNVYPPPNYGNVGNFGFQYSNPNSQNKPVPQTNYFNNFPSLEKEGNQKK